LNKRVLIISPYFPPSNAADMQRVRMSLPYFTDFGWDAEVVTVDPMYSEMAKDVLLCQSLPKNIEIHTVDALNKGWTSKIGLGSIALRSLWFYRQTVNRLLRKKSFNLIYFSTTQFPVCVLGQYWKKKFKIPYVIDMQDPWHSDYYRDKPKEQRPPKYWFSYRLNKYLEPIAIKQTDGLIAVSEKYITDLKTRYPQIKNIPASTIPFGAFERDMEIALENNSHFKNILSPNQINVVYIGRGGADMHRAVAVLFEAVEAAEANEPGVLEKLRMYFIGTSYAAYGKGKETIMPLARQFGLENNVVELTDRISFYHALITLQKADALFIPGSDDPGYTASKIYPYLLSKKPLLAIFNSKSPALDVLNEYGVKYSVGFEDIEKAKAISVDFLKEVINGTLTQQVYNQDAIKKYSAVNMTHLQCSLFNQVLELKH